MITERRSLELNDADLNLLEVVELPEREVMSLVNANIAAPINAAIALNALSDNSSAVAVAQQFAPITQTT